MKIITLPNGIWQFDPSFQLGPRGGFGAVFAGFSEKMGEVAIKEIALEAHREIRIADELFNRSYQNVIPIYDAGQDVETGMNYLVMARAEKSLQDEIRVSQRIDEQEAIAILLQIVTGLMEVPRLVHRDLKPGNILFHSGTWKITDFGIAKFVEESTSLQTLKDCLTPSYAAPEQWNLERPTSAVDVYALGCIAFAMLTGSPPFSGSSEDLKDQHLHHQPPIAKIPNPRLQTLIGLMLRKTPETRPTLERIKTLLEQLKNSAGNNPSNGLSALSIAAAKISVESAMKEAQKLSSKSEEDRRFSIAREGQEIMSQIVDTLFQRIQHYAPNAVAHTPSKQLGNYTFYPNRLISLSDAELAFDFTRFSTIPAKAFERSGWDVFTGVTVKVTQKSGKPYIWSANLWFTNLGKGQEYRWWEVAYMAHPFMRSQPKYEPYFVDNLSDADIAASPGMAHIQFGAKPKIVDDENIDEFCNRWADLLAKAAIGQISHPRSLPLD
jgi:serine/threonine protein kinase